MMIGIFLLLITSKSVATIPCARVSGNYANNNYVTSNMISPDNFQYSTNARYLSDHPLSYAFDMGNAYWTSDEANNETFKNSIFINFDTPTELEAILIDPTYHTDKTVTPRIRYMDGFPLILSVYSSTGNRPYELVGKFTGKAIVDESWTRVQYVFKRPFKCDKLKIEFTEVSIQTFWVSQHKYVPSAQRIMLIGARNHFNMPIEPLQSDICKNAVETSAFTYTSSPDLSSHPISYAFDNVQNTYWISQNENTDDFKNYITVTFNNPTKLVAFSLYSLYSTNQQTKVRTFAGFPYLLNVYISSSDQNVKMHTVFSGSPKDGWDHVQMAFKNPVVCKTLKIEFVTVGQNQYASNKYCPGAHSITFYKEEVEEIQYVKSTYTVNDVKNKRVWNVNFARSTDGGSFGDKAFSNLFDDNFERSYWIAQYANDTFRPSVFIEFNEPVSIDSIYVYNAFSTDNNKQTRRFDGAPTILKVYTGTYNSNQYELNTIFKGNPGTDISWASTTFPFKRPLYCEKLKIEFTEVTNNPYSGAPPKAPYLGALAFIKSANSVPDEIIGLNLSDFYSSPAYIEQQKVQIDTNRISASSAANGHEVNKAFDNNPSTYWKAANANSKPYITISFENSINLDAIIIRPSNNEFTGYPVLINAYALTERSSNEFQFIARLALYSQPSIDGNVYSFSSPIEMFQLKLEIEHANPISTKDVIPEIGEIILIKEPSQIQLPSQPGEDIVASGDTCNLKYRCDQHVYEEVKTNLVIQGDSSFSDYISDVDGGALHLINCGLQCTEGTTFRDCESREGGGAIYFKDDFTVGNKFEIKGAKFNNCKAVYGGAIYIYTENDTVIMDNCEFRNNEAQQSSTGSPFYGGSALFLTYNEGDLKNLKFYSTSGVIVKIFNNFNVQPPSLKLLDQKHTISISQCTFNAKENTESSIYYVRGNGNALVKVSECDFIGKLREGAHHVDGELVSSTSPKLILSSCRFSSSKKFAFDLNPKNAVVSANMKEQVFNYKRLDEKVSTAIIISACTVIAALAALIIFAKKKKTPAQSENAEKSEEETI